MSWPAFECIFNQDGDDAGICSPAEKTEAALERRDASADGVMIARGDMGVSLPIWEVPIVQKQIVAKCNKAKKLVVVATQMLESMTEHLRPTRAEVSDVANAILDGTDYVMLSAETAVGKHPVETVKMMNNIIKYTEQWNRQ